MSKKAVVIGLAIAAAGVLVLFGVGGIFIIKMLGHRSYVVTGRAMISPSAVAHVKLPALVCSGRGGPLESSGVYGQPLGTRLHRSPQVFCATPTGPTALEYEESVYYGKLPREMHVYVWLESHPELETKCQAAQSPLISVERRDLKGYGADKPTETPCFAPDKVGSLGYAVTFRTEVPGDRETRQIAVEPRAYP